MSAITLKPVKSSNLSAFGYDPATETLAVQFQNGTVYHYAGVPAGVAAGFESAESPGRYFLSTVRGAFEGVKQAPESEGESESGVES